MNTLNEKLKAIFINCYELKDARGFAKVLSVKPEAIEQIKQAFIDDGWIPPVKFNKPPANLFGEPVPFDPALVIASIPIAVMTGQEWYDRFEKELKGKIFPHHCTEDIVNVAGTLEECRAAARKASGLE